MSVSFSQRLGISVSAIFYFLLLALFIPSMPVLVVWSYWVAAAVVFVALLSGLLLYALWRLVFGAKRQGRGPWQLMVTLFAVYTVLLACPVYYLVYKVQADPPLMPNVVLSNGEKTVVFQGMIHVGMEGFYKAVVYDLEAALQDGYRLYYEGVQKSPGEGDEWFADTLAGGGDLAENYQQLSDACGVKFQMDYFQLLAEEAKNNPAQHVAADVTTLEMKQEYERLLQSDADFARRVDEEKQKPAPRFEAGKMLKWYGEATPSQQRIIGILCRGVLSIGVQSENQPERALNKVTLDFRNRKLVERIMADDSARIYITYGAGHLPGVLEELQKADSRWQVESIKWMRGLASPEKLEGSLSLPESMVLGTTQQ